jgi:hypothetical protein
MADNSVSRPVGSRYVSSTADEICYILNGINSKNIVKSTTFAVFYWLLNFGGIKQICPVSEGYL